MTALNKRSWAGARRWNSQHGFTMLEFLIAIIIILLLVTASVAMISRVEVYANVAQAKTEIIQISMAIEMEKYDTGFYTLSLADLKSPSAPAGITDRTWKGPYLKGGGSLDPWNNNYLLALNFSIPSGTTSASYTINFIENTGTDSMKIEAENSKQITGGTVTLNGNVVATLNTSTLPVEFTITTVTLPADNNLQISLNGDSDAGVTVVIPGLIAHANNKNPYLIISRGADRLPGGTGFNADIIWRSDYSGFQN